jgi:predicted RNA-binding Zn-ribbon protein involved in translation (DUF1610 family)
MGFLDDLPDIGFKSRKHNAAAMAFDQCPNCGKANPWKVNRTENYQYFIRRERQCDNCGFKFFTREKAEL